mmetsp:Transcript_990/g.2178  ORF Transcript_990/g.2178 Transcript_990/m.2178 type:complete len:290 (+) Transcript_990:312-1181(+)
MYMPTAPCVCAQNAVQTPADASRTAEERSKRATNSAAKSQACSRGGSRASRAGALLLVLLALLVRESSAVMPADGGVPRGRWDETAPPESVVQRRFARRVLAGPQTLNFRAEPRAVLRIDAETGPAEEAVFCRVDQRFVEVRRDHAVDHKELEHKEEAQLLILARELALLDLRLEKFVRTDAFALPFVFERLSLLLPVMLAVSCCLRHFGLVNNVHSSSLLAVRVRSRSCSRLLALDSGSNASTVLKGRGTGSRAAPTKLVSACLLLLRSSAAQHLLLHSRRGCCFPPA